MLLGVASYFFSGTAETGLRLLFQKVLPCFDKLSGKKVYPNKAAERGNCTDSILRRTKRSFDFSETKLELLIIGFLLLAGTHENYL